MSEVKLNIAKVLDNFSAFFPIFITAVSILGGGISSSFNNCNYIYIWNFLFNETKSYL